MHPNAAHKIHYRILPINELGGGTVRVLLAHLRSTGVVHLSVGVEQNHFVVQWFE